METGAKSALNTHELLSDLFTLRKVIKDEDERTAIENILKRKCFGYIHFVNVADAVNIICFTEGPLKWHREYFNRDWVFFDATGFRSLKIPGYKKIFYYSVVTRHSFTDIRHYLSQSTLQVNTQNIQYFFFLNQLHKNLKIICNSTDKPKLIKTDFSLPAMGGILLQFNQVNLQHYLDQCFKLISEEEEMLSTFCVPVVSGCLLCSSCLRLFVVFQLFAVVCCVPVVCGTHLMKGVKYFIERSNKQLKQLK